ncbi:MAG: prepilin-type N-terminal cleavage/methylation domain-containing protein [Burkholderiales bacterium]|nr:prepilin-type N-terminal cleavage/methylation domain-containing protein [Burkholderiales bacterium]
MSPYSAKARANRARGFSLLEVLVAFVILVLALAVIMRIFSQGMSRVGESENYARAVMLAESKLAQLGAGIPLEEGELSGESEDALHWQVRLAGYEADQPVAARAGEPARAVLPVRLLQVEVQVSWDGDQSGPRSIRQVTLRLAPRMER